MSTIRIEDGVPWIGDRPMRHAIDVDVTDVSGVHIRRFRLPCENGWELSVIFGSGTYSTNRNAFGVPGLGDEPFREEADTVEVAVFDPQGEMREIDGDTIVGWVSPEFVLSLYERVGAFPHLSKKEES
jgi:hypothetical protein